jgi:hypothetical protein
MSETPTSPWDARYAGGDYLFGQAPNTVLAAARLQPGWSALAVADGEGRNAAGRRSGACMSCRSTAPPSPRRRRPSWLPSRAVELSFELADLETD